VAVFLNEDDSQIWSAASYVFDRFMGVLESGLVEFPTCVRLASEARESTTFAMSKLGKTDQDAVRSFIEDGFVRGVRDMVEAEFAEDPEFIEHIGERWVKEALLLKIVLREMRWEGRNGRSVL